MLHSFILFVRKPDPRGHSELVRGRASSYHTPNDYGRDGASSDASPDTSCVCRSSGDDDVALLRGDISYGDSKEMTGTTRLLANARRSHTGVGWNGYRDAQGRDGSKHWKGRRWCFVDDTVGNDLESVQLKRKGMRSLRPDYCRGREIIRSAEQLSSSIFSFCFLLLCASVFPSFAPP